MGCHNFFFQLPPKSQNPQRHQSPRQCNFLRPQKLHPNPPEEPHNPNLKHLAGRALHSSPIRLFDPLSHTPASFQTTFSFQFNTTLNATTSDSDGGSGLTFIIVPDEFTVGRPGPWLGMLNDVCDDDYKAIGIEFDTRKNPEFGDPNDNHVGIDLASIVSSKTINASEVGVNLKDGSIHRAWINYDGQRRFLDVWLGPDTNNYPSKPVFSGALDLSPFLKEYMFVGFLCFYGKFLPNSQHIVLEFLFDYGKRKADKSIDTVVLPEKKQRPRPPNKPRRFTIAELQSATRCFSASVTYKNWSSTIISITVVSTSGCLVSVYCRGLDSRFKVVRDVAESLSYLHSKQLAHKNVKTTSVFLDVSFRAVLGDFGFVLNSSESRRFEAVVSQKADVFDFGIFVLEVVAGRRRRSDPGEMDLLELAWARHESDEKAIVVDRRMGSVVILDQAVRVMEIGLLCTLNENKGRPTMEEVMEFLSSERPVPELPPSRPVALFPYSSTTGLCTGYSCASFK
ncbi:hypothetical protein Acr_25g0004180 [Actinidia rufa]|uniref:Concanavalin A-like lectin protein kinase family protein n=1 Tax=Actinidia rufa TaxID=165716 RepID=A0A7J0GYW5_9ERIC|nr:hypothetical protein Acr_25g0004180 [Actinidia rufa]